MANPPGPAPRWPLYVGLFIVVVVCTGIAAALSFPAQSQRVLQRAGVANGAERLVQDVSRLRDIAITPVLTRLGIVSEEPYEIVGPMPPEDFSPPAAAPRPRTTVATVNSPSAESGAATPSEPSAVSASVEAGTAVVERDRIVVDQRVYSETDADVTAPQPLQPLLPKDPPFGSDPAKLSLVEFVVNQSGEVEVVDLVRPSGDVLDTMLLAAIKAWRFAPALKDGLPVKYRQTILLTY